MVEYRVAAQRHFFFSGARHMMMPPERSPMSECARKMLRSLSSRQVSLKEGLPPLDYVPIFGTMFQNTVRGNQRRQSPKLDLSGIDRVLALLKVVAQHPRGVQLEELAKQLSAPKSTIHRGLAALRRAGFVDHSDGGLYHLGLEFLRVAFDHYDGLDERAVVAPALRSLCNQFQETASYAKLVGGEVVYVAIESPSASIKLTSTVGGRNPAHCTAVGKALLAHALPDRAAVDRYVAEHGPLERRTSATITSARDLHRELEATRRRGYAVDREESEAGVNCVALPVYLGPAKSPSGAVSISGLAHRSPLSTLEASKKEIRMLILQHLGSKSLG
jgi:IclR family transcriptional regulator, acetate operon repressor